MNGKKLLLAGLSATLLLGGAAQMALAAQHDGEGWGRHHHHYHQGRWHRPHFSPAVLYVRMLKEFGNPGDTKLTRDEVKAGVDKIFDQIDVNHDGEITPGEYRAYRQEQMKQWRAEHAKANGDQTQNGQAQGGDQAQANQAQNNQASANQAQPNQAPADQSKSDQAQNDNDNDKGGDGHRHHGPHGRFMHEGGFMRGAMIFRFADTDQSGQISKKEAEDAMNKIFDRLDRNHDGVVNLDDIQVRPLL
ncbi:MULTISPECIES: EF-hand domain-containing protein [unclassified Rhizobium]|jgi:Ca2+-binding EF-hand superfamily protein|uniref:EF-hand domain-containing protein n=1 Tax=unclassified Rhizobium TaxID=2613769 RepID=UPI000646BE5C|nr:MULTISPECIES: EF-hand domain-containing protein [unclassified Rhizobium]MBN8950017.1 calcium-binding protein [Rhizobium tropici]OJY62614.1 MAG: calcium-binding protein [Rhizobium sp. 60-20]RKD74686.1 EF hand domain-containing protein [Rhizobium sp. WW_1]